MKKFYLALLSLLAIGQSASAQFNWTGREINSDILISEEAYSQRQFTDGNTIFLYNIGTGKLVDIGGREGMSLELNEEKGTKFWLIKDDTKGCYLMHAGYNTPSSVGGGDYVGYAAGTNFNELVSVNRQEQIEDNKSEKNIYFTFNQVNSTSTANSAASLTGKGGGFIYNVILGVSGTEEGARYLTATSENEVKLTTTTNGANSEWKIINITDFKDMFDKTYYSEKYPADATFLITAQSFGFQNIKLTESWHRDGVSVTHAGRNTASLAKYYYYEIFEAQAGGQLYQEINIPKVGWYSLTMAGFQAAGGQNQVNAYLFAHTGSHETLPKISNQRRYNCTIELKDITFIEGHPTITADEDQYAPIGQALYNGQYPNQIYFYAASTGTATIGVYFPDGSKKLTAVDNVQLKYLGTSDFVLDENFNGKVGDNYSEYNYNAENKTKDIVRQTMILSRQIPKDTWTTIVLPVNLNRRQVRDCFGMNVKLAILNKELQNNGKTVNFNVIDMFQGLTSEDIVLYANTPYLIRVDEAMGRVTAANFKTSSNYTIAENSQYFVIERMSCNLTTERIPAYTIAKGTDEKGNPISVTFMGVYNLHSKANGNPITAPCYSVYNTGSTEPNNIYLKYYPNGIQSKGFRALLFEGDVSKTGIYKEKNSNSAKPNFITGVAINGISDNSETTEILSAISANEASSNNNIYDLSGRKVNNPIKKGVYIQNGHKFIVK